MSVMVLLLAHSLGSPFLGIGMYTDFFHSSGHVQVVHILEHRVVSAVIPASPVALINSMGIVSLPGALLFFISCRALRTSLSSIGGSNSKSHCKKESVNVGSLP